MRRAVTLALTLLLLFFMGQGVRNVQNLQMQAQSVSLRYRQPINTETLSAEQPCTFWGETKEQLDSEYRRANTRVLVYTGDAGLVYGKSCLFGSFPAPLDKEGCAVSSALADELFQSTNVTGLALKRGNQSYVIRGVFEDSQLLALLLDSEAAFTAVELALTDETLQDPDGWTNQQIQKLGLPQPDFRVYPFELAELASVLSCFPILFGSLVLAFAMLRMVRHCSPAVRDAVVFLLLLALVLALPRLAAGWPQWLTPSRWSDFAWWGQIAEQIGEHWNAWLCVAPAGRDLIFKTGLLKQLTYIVFECVLCEMLRCRIRRAGQNSKQENSFLDAVRSVTIYRRDS